MRKTPKLSCDLSAGLTRSGYLASALEVCALLAVTTAVFRSSREAALSSRPLKATCRRTNRSESTT